MARKSSKPKSAPVTADQPDSPLDAVARLAIAAVRATYVLEYRRWSTRVRGYDDPSYGASPMPRWDGGLDDRGARHQSVWPRIAAWAARNHVDPCVLVRAAFDSWAGGDPPRPNQVLSPRILAACQAAMRDRFKRKINLAVAFLSRAASQIAAVQRLHPERVGIAVWQFLDEHARSEPLLCMCVAVRFGHGGGVRSLWPAATAAYLEAPDDWDRILGSWLPDDLREWAREHAGLQLQRKWESEDHDTDNSRR